MLKKISKYYLIFVILLFNFQLFSQNLKIIYSIESNFDFEKVHSELLRDDPGVQSKIMSEITNQAHLIANKSTYSLEVTGFLSHFYLNSTLENEAFDQNVNKLAQLMSDKGTFYQDAKSNRVFEKLSTNEVLIAYDFNFYQWELTYETQEILGFTCYKATVYYEDKHPMTGAAIPREITVWYAPDLPAYFGPQGFAGLPGLILKKCQKGNCMVATEIKEHTNKISLPKGEVLTREEFQKRLSSTKIGF